MVIDGRIVGRHDVPDLIGVLPAGEDRMISAHEDGILCLWTWTGQELRGPAPFCTIGHGIEDMQASWDGCWIAVKDAAAPASMATVSSAPAGTASVLPQLRAIRERLAAALAA